MRPSQPVWRMVPRAGGTIQPIRLPRRVTRLTPTCRGTVRWAETVNVAWLGEKSRGATDNVAACAGAASVSAATTASPTRRTRARVAAGTAVPLLCAAAADLIGLRPDRRPAGGDRGARERFPRGRALSDAARCDRHRQDGDDGLDHRADPEADARDRTQQDPGSSALQRVPRVLPGQRRRVLRLVLRLLPARGLRPAGRSLHREGLVAERR